MIVHPCESTNHFPEIPGTVLLIDPNGEHLGRVYPENLTEFLRNHNLCEEDELGHVPQLPDHLRRVCDAAFKPILERIDDFPLVSLPPFTSAFGYVRFSCYSEFYTKASMASTIAARLELALKICPYVRYGAGAEEWEIIGYGKEWRNWFNDIVRRVPHAEIVMPPGVYSGLMGAVIRRTDAMDLKRFLNELPKGDWREWVPADLLKQIYY